MLKNEFLSALRTHLSSLPSEDIERSLSFYSEMIDDRIEDGMSEEEAVAAIGDPQEIASQILLDTPLPKLIKAKTTPKRKLRTWEIVLLILGSPVWAPLLIAAFAVFISVYAVIWSVVIVFFAADITIAAGCIGGVFLAVISGISFEILPAITYMGAAFILAGLAIFAFIGCLASVKGMVKLSKIILKAIKSCFIGKEASK